MDITSPEFLAGLILIILLCILALASGSSGKRKDVPHDR